MNEVIREIEAFETKRVVITGGEPLIQQKEIIPLLTQLSNRSYVIEVETNGTIIPQIELRALINQWNVSPKLSNSGNTIPMQVKDCYLEFAHLPEAYFKFVVNEPRDIVEIKDFVTAHNIESSKVILMPEAQSRDQLMQKSLWLVEEAKKNNYRFSTRLQVLLWSRQRRV